MYDVEIYDSSGEELSQLTQWDTNVTITAKAQVSFTSGSGSCQIHFFNKTNNEAYVVYTTFTVANSILTTSCKIPNIVLTDPYSVTGHIVMYYGNNNQEIRGTWRFRIPIVKRPKPSDYVDVDTPDYATVASMMAECIACAENAAESESNALSYKNVAAASEANALNYMNNAESYASDARTSVVSADEASATAHMYADSAEQSAIDAAAAAGSNLYSIGLNPTTGRLSLFYNGDYN